MRLTTRATVALGLGLLGVAAMAGHSIGQDAAARKEQAPAPKAQVAPARVGSVDLGTYRPVPIPSDILATLR